MSAIALRRAGAVMPTTAGLVQEQRLKICRWIFMLAAFAWKPSIGDPTVGGWITVVLYAGAALASYRAAHSPSSKYATLSEVRLWYVLSFSLFILGVNKQLDLQSALTDIGRYLAHLQGWYDVRQSVQLLFIFAMAGCAVVTCVALLFVTARMPTPTRLATLGLLFIILFIILRAASFHHIDRFIGETVLGLRWNWVLEMGGLLFIIASALWRVRELPLRGGRT